MREGAHTKYANSLSSAPGTDALEYYSQVQNAAERRIDSAESIYNE